MSAFGGLLTFTAIVPGTSFRTELLPAKLLRTFLGTVELFPDFPKQRHTLRTPVQPGPDVLHERHGGGHKQRGESALGVTGRNRLSPLNQGRFDWLFQFPPLARFKRADAGVDLGREPF